MGIHVSEEAEMEHTTKELWETSFFTFLSKLFVTLTFIVPITFLEFSTAILTSIFWGLFLITVFSLFMARSQKQNQYKVIFEHVFIAALVVLLAHYLGDLIHEILAT
jgi:VIT1/CCC1 family predicted Fe2+/Mn2+ transporter